MSKKVKTKPEVRTQEKVNIEMIGGEPCQVVKDSKNKVVGKRLL